MSLKPGGQLEAGGGTHSLPHPCEAALGTGLREAAFLSQADQELWTWEQTVWPVQTLPSLGLISQLFQEVG
jgi:hypothetical protein